MIILRRLGRPLELRPDDIIDRLLADIIYSKGFTTADPEFFTRVEPSLRRIVRADRGRQDHLLAVRPNNMSLDIYHEALVDTEAWRELTSDNRAFAQWLYLRVITPGGLSARPWLIAAIYQLKDELAGMVIPNETHKYFPINSPDLINVFVDVGMTWENPDELWWRWEDWYKNHYTDLSAAAADPCLRAKAVSRLWVSDIVSNIHLFLTNEPARKLAAEVLNQQSKKHAMPSWVPSWIPSRVQRGED